MIYDDGEKAIAQSNRRDVTECETRYSGLKPIGGRPFSQTFTYYIASFFNILFHFFDL